ncbi:GAF and ANTAR domain-containing protein [Rhodococcus sp. FXJ9.536]|uniref:GAF and ANTAR domain-containing protein n=2 Tax=Rhodococcus tibetensis TaxID=2965064 RepID=A0ABT1Q9S1_9NOCA|nr:GAF and ANTAR domain-containing protein [Rhodococcus sp. FXJ9.536]MCQ4118438.1 GAF and ANTAR domain-containing protein [Rhodococcus sp. FXJ9.536]
MDRLLRRVCERVVDAIGDADMAGISLERDAEVVTVASTDEAVRTINPRHLPQHSSPGPIGGASAGRVATRKVVRFRLVDAAVRWPSLAKDLEQTGMRSVLSAALTVDESVAGTLDLYGRGDHGFSDLDAVVLLVYTTAIEGLLESARRVTLARNEVTGLTKAMESRAVIEQAKGIVMALQGVSADQAFEILVVQSQQEHLKLAEVARRIVESVTTPVG